MEEDLKEMSENPWGGYNKILGVAGASATVFLVTLILSLFGWLNTQIIFSVGIFISLPFIFVFIFGLALNNPNARIRYRKYGSFIYIALALSFFFLFNVPETPTQGAGFLASFIIGFILSFLIGIFYYVPYRLLRGKGYRISGSISFGVSLFLSLILVFLTKDLTKILN